MKHLNDITIRTTLRQDDIGAVTLLHGKLYAEEFGYGVGFEAYVARGLAELYEAYDSSRSGVWICEHNNTLVGFLALVNRGEFAQLRFFIVSPQYRSIGLGKYLMKRYMDFMRASGYRKSYLLTTDELHAAAHLYTQNGFVLTKQTRSSAFGKEVVENRYDWSLS